MPPHRAATVAERLRLMSGELTAAERKLMAALFANYPMAGLGSITDFAREADVSTPSVLRLAKKLGYAGFPALQEELRSELSAQLQTPISRRERWAADAPDAHILNTFATAAMENLSGSLKLMDHRAFDAVVTLLADRNRKIHIAGGRITGAIASYLFTHLQMARPGVSLLPPAQSLWPQYLLDVGRQDVLLCFDIRRYDARMLDLAASARRAGRQDRAHYRPVDITHRETSRAFTSAAHRSPFELGLEHRAPLRGGGARRRHGQRLLARDRGADRGA